jgi:bifunctional DNA-binding transcriptional regulator/antitoxin component of YhaV-PrlF toxin-antitoxin module
LWLRILPFSYFVLFVLFVVMFSFPETQTRMSVLHSLSFIQHSTFSVLYSLRLCAFFSSRKASILFVLQKTILACILDAERRCPMITAMSKRGQTVVPAEIRQRFHIQPQARLEWITDGKSIRVIPLPDDPICGARGIAKGKGLTKAMMDARKEERNRG